MKKEIREKNHTIRERIKQLESEDNSLKIKTESLFQKGQEIQKQIAQINTERLKKLGAIEELKRQLN